MNLRSVVGVAVVALGLGVTAARAQPTEDEVHQLGRLGYGHDRWSLNRLRTLGLAGYVDEQLQPDTIGDGELNTILRTDASFDALKMQLPQLFTVFGNRPGQRAPAEVIRQLQNEFMLRALLSRRQVQALLTEFWFNHFNVDMGGVEECYVVPYVRDTLRPNVLGTFEALLLSVARSPAMMQYLDNASNFRDGYVRGGQTLGINENYARELMELHTFGVDDQGGVYTQQDIIAAARCLTGWSNTRDGFVYVADGHDTGAKKVMGLRLAAGGGEQDGVKLLEFLARHPRTARNICRKLVRFLVGTQEPALVDRAVQRWDATGGDLRAVTRAILVSPELRAAKDDNRKVRRPTLLLASALRSVEVDLSDAAERNGTLTRLSQGSQKLGLYIYNIEPPTGWTDANGTFVSEGSMIRRFTTFQTLCAAGSRFASDFDPMNANDAVLVTQLGNRILGKDALTPTTRAAIEAYLGSLPATTTPVARARTAMALVFSSPEFGTH